MKKAIYFRRNYKVGDKTNVSFIPAITINCNPPYIAGELDSCWANVKGINPTNKEQSEKAIGMKLLPLEN